MKYQGQPIHLTGKPGDKAIVTFQHTNQFGITENIALQLNKTYSVGGVDENGLVIKDWVYDTFLTCDLNNNRVKSRAEEKSERSLIVDGEVSNQIGFVS